MVQLEEWQKHIRRNDSRTWCGERAQRNVEYLFVDIDHAVLSILQGSRLQPCPACVRVVVQALTGEGGENAAQ